MEEKFDKRFLIQINFFAFHHRKVLLSQYILKNYLRLTLKQLHWYHEYLCIFWNPKDHSDKIPNISTHDSFDISVGDHCNPSDVQQNCYLKDFIPFHIQYLSWNLIFVNKFLFSTLTDFGSFCKLF